MSARRPRTWHPVLFAAPWLWASLLVFFPAWWFAGPDARAQTLAWRACLLWIAASGGALWLWLRPELGRPDSGWRPRGPEPGPRLALYALCAALALLQLPALLLPLTTSGDEDFHAGSFRGIGRALETLLLRLLPGPAWPWELLILLGAAAAAALAWRALARRSPATGALPARAPLAAAIWAAGAWTGPLLERALGSGALPIEDRGNLVWLVRFQPLSKLLWLPFCVPGWRHLWALRLPALLGWLAAALFLQRAVALRERGWASLLPSLYLLVLPGTFYYAHLVYLTTPMLALWCLALYFYECHRLSGERRHLAWTALALNAGALLRLETGYFTLALLGHWLWERRRRWKEPGSWLDAAMLAWFGLSPTALWPFLSPRRPFHPGWERWLDPAKLLAAANDYPFHLGLAGAAALALALCALALRRRAQGGDLVPVALWTIAVSYALYTADYLVPDERGIGLLRFSREWQTAQRFLVSWSPFTALLLAEGAGRLPARLRAWLGGGLAVALLAQATFWAAPLSLPEFTSLRLRAGAEYPHLPAAEIMDFVSRDLARPDTRILAFQWLPISYYLRLKEYRGTWLQDFIAPPESLTKEAFLNHCARSGVELALLPLVWFDSLPMRLEVSRELLADPRVRLEKEFDYAGRPAVAVIRLQPPGAPGSGSSMPRYSRTTRAATRRAE